MSNSRSLRIVAFGDSLTVGYQSPTPEYPEGRTTPYGRFLLERMGDGAEVIIQGVNGELTEAMLLRLERDALDFGPNFVVILGGTNDLGWGIPPDDVSQNLVSMYKHVRSKGIHPVAVTVPSIRGFDDAIPQRRTLNTLIVDYCRMESQAYVDLFTATAEPKTLRLAEQYSNDGLHLTTEGYRLLAERLYHDVFKPSMNV